MLDLMGVPQPENPSHLSQAVQLKLYQAFIFSIPILFSIILLLLFYLFYLKRRASSLAYPPPLLPISTNSANSFITPPCVVGLKGDIKHKLPVILFDEELRARETQCCVCLGEFENKEELLQIPLCKHVFHVECIHLWLHSNSTCPLCRRFVLIPTKRHNPDPPTVSNSSRQEDTTSNQQPQNEPSEEQVENGSTSNVTSISREQTRLAIEGSSSVAGRLVGSGRLADPSFCRENEMVQLSISPVA